MVLLKCSNFNEMYCQKILGIKIWETLCDIIKIFISFLFKKFLDIINILVSGTQHNIFMYGEMISTGSVVDIHHHT